MSYIEALKRAKDPLHKIWEQRMEDIADESEYPAQYVDDAITMLLSPDQIDEIWGTEPEPQTAAARGAPGGAWQLRDVNGQWVNMELVERLLVGATTNLSTTQQDEIRIGFETLAARSNLSAGDAAFPGVVDEFFGYLSDEQRHAAGLMAEALNNPQSAAMTNLLAAAEGEIAEAGEGLAGAREDLMTMAQWSGDSRDARLGAVRERMSAFEAAQAEALTAAQQEAYGPFGGDALGEAGRAYASGSNGEINGYLRGHDVEAQDTYALDEWAEQNGWGPEASSYIRDYDPIQDYEWETAEMGHHSGLAPQVSKQYANASLEVEQELDAVLQEHDPYLPYDEVEAAVDRAVGRADLVDYETGEDIIAEDGTFAVDVLQDSLMYDAIEARGYGVVIEDDSEWRGDMMDAYNREFQEHFFELPQDTLVSRTVDSRAIAALGEGEYEGDLVGDVLAHDAYVSTTLNNANPIDWHNGDNHLLVIEVPEGTEAFYMPGAFPDLSFNGRENELVLPPDTEIEITDFIPGQSRNDIALAKSAAQRAFINDVSAGVEDTVVEKAGAALMAETLAMNVNTTPQPDQLEDHLVAVREAVEERAAQFKEHAVTNLLDEEIDALAEHVVARAEVAAQQWVDSQSQRLGGPWEDMNGIYFAKVVPANTKVSRSIADTIRAQGGFTYDPVAETFVDTGYQVAIPGNETRIDTAEFEERGWEIVDKLFDASAGKQIGGWEYEGQYVFDVSENHRNVATAGAAMISRGEQAIYDFAEDRSVYNPARWEELEPGVYSVWEPETLSIVDRDRSTGSYVETEDGLWVWRPNRE